MKTKLNIISIVFLLIAIFYACQETFSYSNIIKSLVFALSSLYFYKETIK